MSNDAFKAHSSLPVYYSGPIEYPFVSFNDALLRQFLRKPDI